MTGAWPRARIICQCARHHPALLANGASCSHSLPVGSPNPSPADAFAKRVSRKVLTRGGPQKCVAVMARRQDRQKGRDRKSVVEGKSVYVRVDLGGRRIIKK